MTRQPLISVIVPVYNAEKYLTRCVNSILAQEPCNLEIILVDDGSRDGSPALCDDFAARDPRVRVIHKANGGVSAARNDGIESARGEYIAFCDNDDHYAPGMLARLLALCTENDCDIAQCRHDRSLADSLPTPPPQPVEVVTGRRVVDDIYARATPYIWDKLYRREVWREVRFPVGSYSGEDMLVVPRLMLAARRVALVREKFYCHYLNPASVMMRGFDVRWADGALAALDDKLVIARSEGLGRLLADTMVRRVYEVRYLLTMNGRYNREAASRREFARTYRALLRRYYGEAMSTAGIGAKDKLFVTLCRYTPSLYHLYNWLKWRVFRGDNSVRFGEVK